MGVKWKLEGKGHEEVVGRQGESRVYNNKACYNAHKYTQYSSSSITRVT